MLDVIILGGSFGGLTAALQIARARRKVVVVDAGSPRNRFSAHAHGVLGHDGKSGAQILAEARAQIEKYATVTFRQGLATEARIDGRDFVVSLADGERLTAKALVLATGVVDELSDLPGLAERWGKTILHCPYCHGYEIGGGAIGVLASGPMSTHQAQLVADWGETTLFTNGVCDPDAATRAMLERRRVKIEPRLVRGLEGDAPALAGVRLEDGALVPVRALFTGFRVRMASPIPEKLGCAFEETPLGPVIRTIDPFRQTTVAGVFAGGDVGQLPHSITLATAAGAMAGIGAHRFVIERESTGE